QVAQILINHLSAFIEVGQASLLFACIGIAAGNKNIDKRGGGKDAAGHLDYVIQSGRAHRSVSWRARARMASSSGPRLRSAAATGAERSFQLRIRMITSSRPSPSPAAGSTQATSSKPWVRGSTTAATPQLVRNQSSTPSSLLMVCTLACNSL